MYKVNTGGRQPHKIVGGGVISFGMSDYLVLFPGSSTHPRQSVRHPAHPHQGDKHGPEDHPYHQMGMGLRDLNKRIAR